MVINRNCFPKMTDFFKVRRSTGSHIHRKSGSIKEMVKNRHVVTSQIVNTCTRCSEAGSGQCFVRVTIFVTHCSMPRRPVEV